jgi:hypothetical protein
MQHLLNKIESENENEWENAKNPQAPSPYSHSTHSILLEEPFFFTHVYNMIRKEAQEFQFNIFLDEM